MTNVDKPRRAKAKKTRAPRRRPSGRKDAEKRDESQAERGFLFEDPYWDDAFCSYYDPTLGTCCRR
jgi:hypothetical protein